MLFTKNQTYALIDSVLHKCSSSPFCGITMTAGVQSQLHNRLAPTQLHIELQIELRVKFDVESADSSLQTLAGCTSSGAASLLGPGIPTFRGVCWQKQGEST